MNESFSHREDRNIQNYKTEIASWGKVDFLILIDLSEFFIQFRHKRNEMLNS